MHSIRWATFFCAFLSLAMPSVAQQAGAGGSAPTTGGDPAQVKFLFDWNQGRPWLSYSILVSSDGKAHFDGDPNPVEGGGDEPFQQDFRVSDANRQKIFDLAKRLNYFNGNFDFSKKIAQTGKKTLEYQSAGVRGSTTYNWSENKDVEELTRFFQSIATTLDYGCKLAFQYRFDKLGMDQRVRELEELQAKGDVEELAAIQPILQKIADDPSIMHISRQSAKHLLKSIHGPLPAAAAPSADTPPQPRSAEPE